MIEIQPPSSGPYGRLARSCATLAAPESGLAAALTESVGLPAPFGPLANRVIVRALEILDAFVPIGTVKFANDLVDAARDLGYKSLPPVPGQIMSAQAHITAMISRLTPAELRDTATQLGVQSSSIDRGARIVTLRRNRPVRERAAELLADVDFGDVGYPLVKDNEPGADRDSVPEAVAAIVAALTTRGSADWTADEVESLRCAVALHVAEVGDAFLRASEQPQSQTAWPPVRKDQRRTQ